MRENESIKTELTNNNEDEIDLISFLEVVVRWRWLIFLCVFLSALGSALYSHRLHPPNIYRAEANLVIQTRTVTSSGAVVNKNISIQILNQPELGRRVLERRVPYGTNGRVDTIRVWDYIGQNTMTRAALDELKGMSEFFQGEGGLVTIVITCRDSLVAASLANVFIDELRDYYNHLSRSELMEDLKFLNARIDSAGADLRESQRSLLDFKRQQRERLDQLDLIDELRTEYAWRQMLLNSRSQVYSSLLSQRESLRYEHHLEATRFEVLYPARTGAVVEVGWTGAGRTGVGTAVGCVVGLFLAFLAEYFAKNKASGRLERLSHAYRGER